MTDSFSPAFPLGRKRALIIATAVFAAIALIALLWWLVTGERYVTTENAYVDTRSVVVTAQAAAPVKAVDVNDTDVVKAGDVLVELDDTDAKLLSLQAEAALQMVKGKVRTYYATDSSLRGQAAVAQTNLKAANDAVSQAQVAVTAAGAAAPLELRKALSQAQAAQREAQAQVIAVRGQSQANGDLIDRGALTDHPEIVAAEAKLQQAQANEARMVIRAPVAGIVAKSDVGVGQFAVPGAPLMTIVPVDAAYVNANFKEAQLRHVTVGQGVVLTSDLYGKGVKFHGKVAGIAAGTGSTLALIPAQNATGNWIKVVQRIPVRITLDATELKAHPLRLGMTMTATIDTKAQ